MVDSTVKFCMGVFNHAPHHNINSPKIDGLSRQTVHQGSYHFLTRRGWASVCGGTIIFWGGERGRPVFFQLAQGWDQKFSQFFSRRQRGGPFFFHMQRGLPEKNWRPAITDRRPPLPVKNDCCLKYIILSATLP